MNGGYSQVSQAIISTSKTSLRLKVNIRKNEVVYTYGFNFVLFAINLDEVENQSFFNGNHEQLISERTKEHEKATRFATKRRFLDRRNGFKVITAAPHQVWI
jgi:hypothetical protein